MNLQLLVVPYDSGHRGARMGAGPERLIEAGVESALSGHGHVVRTTRIDLPAGSWTSEIGTAFELMRRVAAAIPPSGDTLPVLLAGNCITTIGALAAHPPERTGIVWFDAHGDFNTPDTTTSGFLDGTALSAITGGSWRQLALTVPGFKPVAEENVCVVGARDFDPVEKRLLAGSGITTVAPADVRSGLESAIASIATRVALVHVHIDLDVLDAGVARANTYAVGGGLTIESLEFALSAIGH
ncbi:MAG: arginase family protein, partial [Gemmatimonadota bacterium]|nr:arginase family protein [Gemmatimonadota bacterium]